MSKKMLIPVIIMCVILIVLAAIVYTNEQKENEKICMVEPEKVVYLTFDDGPSKNTKKVLDILDKEHIKATFFVIGSCITPEYEEQIKEMEKNGHKIGIHTYSHKYSTIYLSCDAYIKDFELAYDKLCSILEKRPTIYRFPGGSCNCYVGECKKDIIKKLDEKGFKYYDWHISGEDSVGKPSASIIYQNVIKDFKNFDKPIILLHDSSINKATVDALSDIIKEIKKAGFSFSTL